VRKIDENLILMLSLLPSLKDPDNYFLAQSLVSPHLVTLSALLLSSLSLHSFSL